MVKRKTTTTNIIEIIPDYKLERSLFRILLLLEYLYESHSISTIGILYVDVIILLLHIRNEMPTKGIKHVVWEKTCWLRCAILLPTILSCSVYKTKILFLFHFQSALPNASCLRVYINMKRSVWIAISGIAVGKSRGEKTMLFFVSLIVFWRGVFLSPQ